jgi:prepilin signal peptidase PulO-like enzyme (type II secretory pathway)
MAAPNPDAATVAAATVASAPATPLVSRPVPVAVAALGFCALAFACYPFGAGAVIAAFMAAVLVVLTATDLERRVIPNRVVLPAAAIVLVARVAFFPGRWLEFILSALLAGLAFLIPNLINTSLMGMGDVKLAFLLGAGLGWSVGAALMLALLSVFPVALATVIRGGLSARKTALPFGPFLAFGGVFVLIVPHLAGFGAG